MTSRTMSLGAGALLFSLVLTLSDCSSVESTLPNTIDRSDDASSPEDTEAQQSEPWWEGRMWAGEIDVCVTATDDEPGCQWLAGLLIHRRCELKMYQTFAAALFVGAPFDALYQDAVDRGECQDIQGVSSAEASSRLGQSAPNIQNVQIADPAVSDVHIGGGRPTSLPMLTRSPDPR